MTTLPQSLFDWRDREQARQCKRVHGGIGRHVVEFCRRRLELGQPEFHMQELAEFVQEASGRPVAPDSAGRILRLLKRSGQVQYEVKSRSASLYRLGE